MESFEEFICWMMIVLWFCLSFVVIGGAMIYGVIWLVSHIIGMISVMLM